MTDEEKKRQELERQILDRMKGISDSVLTSLRAKIQEVARLAEELNAQGIDRAVAIRTAVRAFFSDLAQKEARR